MRISHWLASAIGAVALAVAAMPVQAAPTAAVIGNAEAVQDVAASGVEQVHNRCYRHRGHWHCPRHRHRHYRNYGYYPYYFSPGFSLYIGPRHHRRHWH